jgi:hypothetical protein
MADAPPSLGLERRNPLPKGRYWVFRIGARQITDFDAWLTKWRKQKALGVRTADLDPGTSSRPQTAFILFEVFVDDVVVWDQFGLPDRAPGHVTSRSDVETPEPPDPLDQLADAATRGRESLAANLAGLPGWLLVGGLLYLFATSSKD